MSDENTQNGPVGPQGEPGQAPPPPKAPEILTITSLDQLQRLIDAPIWCEFKLDGRPMRVECHRPTQALDEQVRALRRKAQPEFKKERGPNGDYDYAAPAFLAAREANEKIARALLIYACCPVVAASRPGLLVPEKIAEYVRGLLSEGVLDLLATVIQVGGLDLMDRVNFTLPASLAS
jgi:hypothetical protein